MLRNGLVAITQVHSCCIHTMNTDALAAVTHVNGTARLPNGIGEQAGKHLEKRGFSGPPWGEQLQGSGAACVGEDFLDIPNRGFTAAEQFRPFFSPEID